MQDFEKELKELKAHGAVLYTDGSARPNPGFTGSGIHGYFYVNKELNKPVSGDGMIMTRDGYVRPPSVKEAFVDPVKYIDVVGANDGVRSNNYAEAMALSKALEIAVLTGIEALHVISDSRLALDGVGWCESWSRNGWRKSDGGEIKNVELWQALHENHQKFLALGGKFTSAWIKGHDDQRGNTEADILAAVGCFRSTDGNINWDVRLTDPKGYWKNEVERHPFLNIKRIFFNAEERHNVKGLYYQGDSGVGDFISGKRTPVTSYSVIQLNEADGVIESIRERNYKHAKGDNAIMMIKCDEVFSKRLFHWIEQYGGDSMTGSKDSLNLQFTDETPITIEMNPTGLAPRCIEGFNILEELLLGYKKHQEDSNIPFTFNGAAVQISDITSRFYEDTETKRGEKTKTLKGDFIVGLTDISIDFELKLLSGVKEVKIPYILGLDFLPRNNLKKLESLNPKVTLISWAESEKSYRYATIAECDSGIGIWSNYHADRIFVNP